MDHNPLFQGVSTQLQNLSPGSPQSITFNKPKLFSIQICFGLPVQIQPSALKWNYISVDVIFVIVTFIVAFWEDCSEPPQDFLGAVL